MDGGLVLLGLIVLLVAIGTPIAAIVALVRTADLRQQNARLASEVAALRRRIEQGVVPAVPPPGVEVEAAPVPLPVQELEPPPAPSDALPPPFAETVPPPAPVWETPAPRPEPVGWEQRLGARAFIWVGAITLALAAIFLVRYSIEEGWLSPEVRVILAALFGFALIGGAEKVKTRDDRVAQAMAAAGIAAIYGALFAAVTLYGMVSKPMAGVAAGALTAFAIGLSLRHGILVAALAFVGGFASPAIIGSETPNTPVLFGYLFAIAAGTMAVIRYRGWWLLGWGVLAGSAGWTIIWLLADVSGLHWVGLFLVAVAGLFVWTTWRRLGESDNPPIDVAAMVWAALATTGALLAVLVVLDEGRQTAGWVALGAHGVGLYALGRWTPRFQYVAALAPALSLATIALWWFDGHTDGLGPRTIVFGTLYAAGAFALMWNAARPGFWAALSVSAALAHFLFTWWALRNLEAGTPWGLISIGLAAPFLVGAERLAHWRERMAGATEALGFLAAGVSFFIAAAIPLELSREWITVAYAIELAAVAYIADRLALVAMRWLCWPLLAAVLIRFVLNPEVLHYGRVFWGYAISIVALAVASRFLGEERLRRAVQAGAALLTFVMVTLEVRILFRPVSMDALEAAFLERAVHVVVWGAFALAALWIARLRHDPVALWAWRLSGGLALGTVMFVQVFAANPIDLHADVGALPIFNGLLLAYALPALMVFLARRWSDIERSGGLDLLLEASVSILALVYISFEVRHAFDPGFERHGFAAEGLELYAYSIVWLLFGVALLALGFWRDVAALRHAGMVLVCLVVAKVFLIDMAGLEGLLRVFSFLGLGAALLGLGYAYRRFGLEPRTQK
ncbi:MAG: DUF2339 domain-containing protein [Reyranella sp.]|uniref:DUF2339 domain-containing protein n=1 Tax=Reyranella sp. TaxID=1929291 RepID=UPI001AD1C39C|nr:DUF2339 domain-containing protein [Reyranella sp.]MBN9090947.1 DUF2339 domain-containing protein [Reyranella sp.]